MEISQFLWDDLAERVKRLDRIVRGESEAKQPGLLDRVESLENWKDTTEKSLGKTYEQIDDLRRELRIYRWISILLAIAIFVLGAAQSYQLLVPRGLP